MGGIQVLMTVLKQYGADLRDTNLRGVIAEAPWLSKSPARPVGWMEHATLYALSWVWPSLRLPTGVDLFTDDLHQGWVNLCKESGKYCYTVTPKLAMSVEAAQQFARENIQAWPADVSLLFLQGQRDPLVDATDNIAWAQAVADREDTKVVVKSYPTGTHVLLKCPIRADVARDILEFIDANTA
jgi:alpha-beta hydrolase superfamily lysophospholipase